MASAKTASFVRLDDTDLTVADPREDIRRRKVVDRNGNEIGEVKSLFIDEDESKVRFLELASRGFLGIGGETRLIPIEAIEAVSEEFIRVVATRDQVHASPRFSPELTHEERYWLGLYGYYGYPPFWR